MMLCVAKAFVMSSLGWTCIRDRFIGKLWPQRHSAAEAKHVAESSADVFPLFGLREDIPYIYDIR